MTVEDRIEIDAPVSRVWARTIDIEGWPAFTPTIDRVERLDRGELRVGSRARLDQPGQPERVWTVTELEPGRRFAWSTRFLAWSMTASHELVPTDGGTTNVLRVDLEGPAAGLVGALLRRPLRKAIATENRGFKAAVEG